MNLISQTIKKEADVFLVETNLLENLCTLGEVKIVGSYFLDLMVQKDIDIYIINDEIPTFSKLNKFINNFMELNEVYYQKFEDNNNLLKPEFPKGIYMGFKIINGWKLDLWFLTPDEAYKKLEITDEIICSL